MLSTRQINMRLVQAEACARQLFYCESTVPAGESLHGLVAVCNSLPGALAED